MKRTEKNKMQEVEEKRRLEETKEVKFSRKMANGRMGSREARKIKMSPKQK